MWIAIIAIATLILLFGVMLAVIFLIWLNKITKEDRELKEEHEEPVHFQEDKPCGAVTENNHPCDYTKHYACRSCELGI